MPIGGCWSFNRMFNSLFDKPSYLKEDSNKSTIKNTVTNQKSDSLQNITEDWDKQMKRIRGEIIEEDLVKEEELSFLRKISLYIDPDRIVNNSNKCEYDNSRLRLSKGYIKRKVPEGSKDINILDWYIVGTCPRCGRRTKISYTNDYGAIGGIA